MEMYIIGEHKPLEKSEIENLNLQAEGSICYKKFLSEYGFGSINDLILVEYPDEYFFKNNFSDYTDIWQWKNEEELNAVMNGITIMSTIDGDFIQLSENSYILVPRHDETVTYFTSFEDVIDYYTKYYDLEDLYFQPGYNHYMISISLIKDSILDEALIDKIQSTFLERYNYDKVYNASTQPKYVLQSIGGYICFDMIYKNGIRIEYQKQSEIEAKEIENFIRSMI